MPPLMPSNAQDYYNRGRNYHRQANYDHAISDYTQAIELKPNYADAYAWRALAYFEKKGLSSRHRKLDRNNRT